MALKVKPEHIQPLRDAMSVFLTKETEEIYTDAGLSEERYLWDAFWSACKHTPSLDSVVREIYTYADDTHLYSVFCVLWREKQNG